MQEWKIVNSSKYTLSCCTYVFQRCRFVLAFSVLAFSTLAYSYLRIPYCIFHPPVLSFSVLAFSVAPLVSVSVSSWYSIEMSERIVLVFGTKLPSTYPTLCLMESTYLQNKGTSFWNFAPDSGLEDFATAYRSSKCVTNQRSSRKVATLGP